MLVLARSKTFPRVLIAFALGSTHCTLTSEPFTPGEALHSRAIDAGSARRTSDAGPPPVAEPSAPADCARGELAGCALELALPGAECALDLDCESGVCAGGVCAAASCEDGRRNGSETGVDCGGTCTRPCASDPGCATGKCDSAECSADKGNTAEARAEDGRTGNGCESPTCSDGVRNGREAAVDCGGPCAPCDDGASCASDADCESSVCGADVCAAGSERCCQPARCDDGVKNGGETSVDCGNAACGLCPLGAPCSDNAQCDSGLCQGGACELPPCADRQQNGTESDVDCGGDDPSCTRCEPGDSCTENSDCASETCVAGACVACNDGVQNGDETGVDCGGACAPCVAGAGCALDADCESGACEDSRCCGGSAADCTRCARRLAPNISCNGNEAEAAPSCEAFLDCLADNSDVCSTRLAPGCSDAPSAVCDPDDFGGNAGAGVRLADAILGNAQCDF